MRTRTAEDTTKGPAPLRFATEGARGTAHSGVLGAASVVAVIVGTLLLAAPPALAAKGVVNGLGAASSGTASGLFSSPHGLAVNTSGNGGVAAGTLYVADTENNRVQSFSSSGAFLRAWGTGVVTAGAGNVPVNEQQTVTLGSNTTGGTFTLTFTTPGPSNTTATTANIAFNAPASGAGSVQEALEGLANIGAGNVAVTGSTGGPWTVEFKGTRLADTNVNQMTASVIRLTVSSGSKSATVATAVEGASAFEVCTVASSCTRGAASAAAGGMSAPQGIAIEQSTGNVYVTDQGNKRVDVFSATGAFEGAFGRKVKVTGAAPELQICTVTSGCQAGEGSLGGAASGQLSASLGYPAVSPLNGHLLVPDRANRRVDEFEPTIASGEVTGVSFVRGYGWGVENGNSEFQICTSTCQAPAAAGAAQGQFATNGPSEVGVDSSGDVYALDPGNNRVQEFSSSGTPIDSSFAAAQLGSSPAAADLYVDPTSGGHVFVNKSNGTEVRTLEFETSGNLLESNAAGAGIASSAGLAYDSASGNIYISTGQRILVLNTPPIPPTVTVNPVATFSAHTAQLRGTVNPNGFEVGYHFEYSSNGSTWIKLPTADLNIGGGGSPITVSQEAKGLTANTSYQVKLVATKPFGAGSSTAGPVTFTTAVAPSVDASYAITVGTNEAQLGAEVNPNGIATTYQFEYVDAAHYKPLEANPYAEGQVQPVSPEALGAGIVDVSVSQRIEGLTLAATYHYRVVAINVIGITDGPDRSITTSAARTESETNCPNQILRAGASGALPDCRAYEMVSPVNKNGANIDGIGGPGSDPLVGQNFDSQGGVEQAAANGDSVTYTSLTAFGDTNGAPYGNQYLSAHTVPEGWSTQNVTQPLNSGSYSAVGDGSSYKAFAADLSSGLLSGGSNPPLPGTDAPAGEYKDYYLRNSASGALQALLTATPPQPPANFNFEFKGATGDLSHIVVGSSAALTPGAVAGANNLYEYSGGHYQLINLLPGRTLGGAGGKLGATISSMHAISADGSRVFWFASGGVAGIYMRELRTQTTVQIDASEGPGPGGGGTFWTASADGSVAFFSADASRGLTDDTVPGSGENLYEYDVEAPEGERLSDLTPVATAGVQGVIGASEGGSYLYFVANGVLTGQEENSEGVKAEAGQPNIYLLHGATTTFIATASTGDSPAEGGDWGPNYSDGGSSNGHTARVSPDGGHLVFMSTQSLTGIDNVGQHCVPVSHQPEPPTYNSGSCSEVYLYTAGSNQLNCVTCERSGERPRGPSSIPYGTRFELNAAAYLSRILSDNGSRVFFDSSDALVHGDTNGKQDVYEWEADGTGSCRIQAGCQFLISSGTSGSGSSFVDASTDGSNVFFVTAASLVPRDPGLVDLYDARENGGESPEELPPGSCEGDACQAPPPPPNDSTPASSNYSGPGNVHESSKQKQPSKHHKHHKKRKHHEHHKRAADTYQGAGK